MWITKTSINQPVFATMVMLALVVLGGYSYRLLPVEQMPEINVPQAYVTVNYPGASPEAIENDVIKPLENVINSVEGVKNIYSTASRQLRKCATRSPRSVRRCLAMFASRRFRAPPTTAPPSRS